MLYKVQRTKYKVRIVKPQSTKLSVITDDLVLFTSYLVHRTLYNSYKISPKKAT